MKRNLLLAAAVLFLVVGTGAPTKHARAQSLLPLPDSIPTKATPRSAAIIGFGSVNLSTISDIDATGSGRLAIAFWPNRDITSFVSFNRSSSADTLLTLEDSGLFFPESSKSAFQAYLALTWDAPRWDPTHSGAQADSTRARHSTMNRIGVFFQPTYQKFSARVDSVAGSFETIQLTIGGLYDYTFIPDSKSRFRATVGLAWRWAHVLSSHRASYDALFRESFDDERPSTSFSGVAMTVGLQVNDFAFEFELQTMSALGTDDEFAGLTGWSGVVRTTVSGSLLRFFEGTAEQ